MSEKKLVIKNENTEMNDLDNLYSNVEIYINNARTNVVRSINTEMVKAYWFIGREVVLYEQEGKDKAEYGKSVLQQLSIKLTKVYGKGFSVVSLTNARRFYLVYQVDSAPLKSSAVRTKFECPKFNPSLSWTHYRILMRITRSDVRNFYEKEAIKNKWSYRELEKQINSLLFERLLKSRDKKGLMQLASKGQEISKPEDVIKDPLILDFLDLPESHRMVESKLEQALIDNMQHFLIALGKGFCFAARQKRISLNGDHFYIDLVFYHAILNCYILIDLKTKKLTHGDLGQMQFYVNYYDREIKKESDLPTIGLVLCTEKNNEIVKYTLDEKTKQIFASKYQFALPTEKELAKEMQREIEIFEQQKKKK